MKTNTIGILMILFLMVGTSNLFAQKTKDVIRIRIKTSAQCEMCKAKLEHGLLYIKGIKSAFVLLKEGVIIVKFKKSKINPDEIRKAIAKIGYDADDVPAEKAAYDQLDACCKKLD
ncbi:MAG: heavy-metal-associated domain-containing protein [Bacteroidetes bacterium]|nr:heavy-metal-associated domain-containing protein [Bacteroidota bacterium]